MHAERLFTLKSLSIMFLLCFLLTAEEAIHLVRSHPNKLEDSRTIAFHPNCLPLEATGRILRCPVPGYGDMNFICSKEGCWAKEPSNGLFITASEAKLLDNHFKVVNEEHVK
ncbi:MAG TPA: hypothetical protein VGM02_16725 [Acidobacteriaceae bacterium]|jgi:hypothetical protein